MAIRAQLGLRYDEILTAPALEFLASLHRTFETRRRELISAGTAQQAQSDAGAPADSAAPLPSWAGNLERQIEIKDALASRLLPTDAEMREPGPTSPAPIMHPRGWHLLEQHLLVDGQPISGALFDFGLCVFHNAAAAAAGGLQVLLPHGASDGEAQLWKDVIAFSEEQLRLPSGTVRADLDRDTDTE